MTAVGQEAGVRAILSAARMNGMSERETAALLAAGYHESGWNPGSIGDRGSSFGLFQQHVGGAGGPTLSSARQYLTPAKSAGEAAARFKAAGVASGTGAAASQRPADQASYARAVDGIMRKILAGTFAPLNRIVGSGDTTLTSSSPAKARSKWSPQRDQVAAKAHQLGLRHTSGDRSPASNSAAGGVENSEHLSTRTDVWADDYVGSEAAMAQLVAFARGLSGIDEAMVHDAGSGRHAHIAGRASSSSSSGDAIADAGNQTVGLLPDGADPKAWALKSVVVLVGLALAAGLIFAGVTRLTGTEKLAGSIVGGVVPG